jgi:hypothetical protein
MSVEKILSVVKRIGFWVIFLAALLFIILMPKIFHQGKRVGLYLQAIGVCASTAIAIFAIWGEQIRARFFGPKLVLSLDRKEGQLTHFRENNKPVRFFHLRVQNKRKGTLATKTQVILSSIVRPHKEGTPKPLAINGRLPFPWKFRGGDPDPNIRFLESVMYSVIGPDDYCDLALLAIDGDLTLRAEPWKLIEDFLVIKRGENTTVEIIAIAENGQSNLLSLNIFWDGIWPVSDEDAPSHVIIQPRRHHHWWETGK